MDVHDLQSLHGSRLVPRIFWQGERLVWDLAITLYLNTQFNAISTIVVTLYNTTVLILYKGQTEQPGLVHSVEKDHNANLMIP